MAEDKKPEKETPRENRAIIIRELRLMSRAEKPYTHFANVSPMIKGIWNLAAKLLEEKG